MFEPPSGLLGCVGIRGFESIAKMISVRVHVVQEDAGVTLGRIAVKYDAQRLRRWFDEQGRIASVGLDLRSKLFFVRVSAMTREELHRLVVGSTIELL